MAEHEPDGGVNETLQSAARVAITAGGLLPAALSQRERTKTLLDLRDRSK